MANIILTSNCNLRCPYCFAEEYMQNNNSYISDNNFKKAVDFIVKNSHKEYIGIIGGEPLLHPEFKGYIKYLNDREDIDEVMVFTNGILLDSYQDILIDSDKIKVLLNCNCESIMGPYNYSKMLNNIKNFVEQQSGIDKLCIGLNIYSTRIDYDYILDILERNGLKRIRLSITVPDTSSKKNHASLLYYRQMKEKAFTLIKKLIRLGVSPFFDCNLLPICLLNDEEREELIELFKEMEKTNVLSINSRCMPVIDITENLELIRCFAFSDKKVSIDKFETLEDARRYFSDTIDTEIINNRYGENCINCIYKDRKLCFGGCLSFNEV